MKRPLFLVSNDWHLDSNNCDQIIDLFHQMCKAALDAGVECIILAGDIFDSRSSQRLNTLLAFKEIVRIANENGIILRVVPGNHDKTRYDSYNSWLDVFDGFYLYRDVETINFNIKGKVTKVTLIPFFEDEMLIDKINMAEGSDMLISHFELNGSTFHGVEAKGRAIEASMLKKWKKTYLGHYHDHNEVTKDVVHLPSLYQRNFGENNKKGFTMIYDDLSYEHIQSNFKPFETIKMDIDAITPEETKDILKRAKNNLNLRLEITGATSKIKAFKKDKFVQAGIDIKTKHEELIIHENYFDHRPNEVKEMMSNENVEKIFDVFCKEEELDLERGKVYLGKILSNRKE